MAKTHIPSEETVRAGLDRLGDGLTAIAGAIGAVGDARALTRDASTGRYSNDSLAAYVNRHRTGLLYSWRVPAGSPTAMEPVSAAAKRLAATKFVPATIGTPATDPYDEEGGPWFHVSANAGVDADGTPWVEAIDGVDYGFARRDNGRGNNVYEVAPVVWQRWEEQADGSALWTVSDTRFAGAEPCPKAYLPDGSLRPYMLTPSYPLSVDSGGSPRSVSGLPVKTRTVSHDSLIDITRSATTGYSGMSTYDQWYVNFHQLTKTLCKSSQVEFPGCTSFNLQFHPAIAESNVTRIVVAASTAASLPVGCALMYGTSNAASCPDRGDAAAYDVFDGAVVEGKETLADGNVALLMGVSKAFSTATDTWVQTAPWNTGSTDGLAGDGQAAKDGRHAFRVGGVETATGVWEAMGDALFVSDGTGFGVAVNPDTKEEKKGAVASGVVPSAACMPVKEGYTLNLQMVDGLILGKDLGGSSTTGTGDDFYVNPAECSQNGAVREVRFLGGLGSGSVAGLRYASARDGSGGAWWGVASRLSATGRSRG